MMNVEGESVVNKGLRNPGAARWESYQMDIRSIVLHVNAYRPFTWYKEISGWRSWMQRYGTICVAYGVEKTTLLDQRTVLLQQYSRLMPVLYVPYVWQCCKLDSTFLGRKGPRKRRRIISHNLKKKIQFLKAFALQCHDFLAVLSICVCIIE